MSDHGGDKLKTNKPLAGSRVMIYLLLGVGVLACCCSGGVGLWRMLTPDPLVGTWQCYQTEDAWAKSKDDFFLVLKGDHTGLYRVGNGEDRPILWNVNGKMLELEMTGDGTFWTGEKKARFTYTISGQFVHELTLVPAAVNQPTVKFSKTSRGWPT